MRGCLRRSEGGSTGQVGDESGVGGKGSSVGMGVVRVQTGKH